MAKQTEQLPLNTHSIVNDILAAVIDRDREREIITRRYGLFERKETLEQIGELLGITRERVRQLEKSVMTRLRLAAEQGSVPYVAEVQSRLLAELKQVGGVARVSELAGKLVAENNREEQSRLSFLAQLCPDVIVVEEDNDLYQCVAVKQLHDAKQLKKLAAKIIDAVKTLGEAKPITDVAERADIANAGHAAAIAAVSKHLATLNGTWGLIRWPMVNPKNIRDKIYVILHENGKHMHFNDIAAAIKQSDFKRKDVTTQAIHNELIKDERFVLIGRGIYALKEWGYQKGTVADIITQVLQEAGVPLHRDEIVKRVLKTRYVKETTILLNLQGKPQFKRVAKATYALAELPAE
ncbi:MAG TPA: sigma factor-like helix-turn-helix DNA-binding protein [Candidatus Saccharimonadales bacterium]|nr:sigma factor-like helix-turn-helix DNA-binding protein [Candidatus Saccharimonadales bacterium]